MCKAPARRRGARAARRGGAAGRASLRGFSREARSRRSRAAGRAEISEDPMLVRVASLYADVLAAERLELFASQLPRGGGAGAPCARAL